MPLQQSQGAGSTSAPQTAAPAKPGKPIDVAQMEAMNRQYANPLYRMPMTFIEIFPVGFLIALASAALLRNPRFLPARRG